MMDNVFCLGIETGLGREVDGFDGNDGLAEAACLVIASNREPGFGDRIGDDNMVVFHDS